MKQTNICHQHSKKVLEVQTSMILKYKVRGIAIVQARSTEGTNQRLMVLSRNKEGQVVLSLFKVIFRIGNF